MSDADESTRATRRSAYLPILPEGWHYGVQILGPDGEVVTLTQGKVPADGCSVRFEGPKTDDPVRTSWFDSLHIAASEAVHGVKALVKVREAKARAAAEEAETLDVFGTPAEG